MSEWQPIDTAKRGIDALFCGWHGEIFMGWVNADGKRVEICHADSEHVYWLIEHVTHWMPLPNPPEGR